MDVNGVFPKIVSEIYSQGSFSINSEIKMEVIIVDDASPDGTQD